MEYVCKCCDYKTTYQTNYKKHLESKKHKELAQEFVCKYCKKGFSFKQSMYRHMKYTCKNNDKDLKEEVRLLAKDQEELQKQIEKISEKLEMQCLKT
jgi:uncharacterized Zn-finger protein